MDGRGWVVSRPWLVHPEANDPRGGDRMALVEQELEAHPAPDHAEFHGALLVYGTVQPRGNRHGTIFGMPGDDNGSTAQALDTVVTAFGLDVDYRSVGQTRAIDQFGRCHKCSCVLDVRGRHRSQNRAAYRPGPVVRNSPNFPRRP